MRLLKLHSTGPSVELLQLALNRAGFGPLEIDGVFGTGSKAALIRFQQAHGIVPDGVAGRETNTALLPWFTGTMPYTVRRGDSLYSIAKKYKSSVDAIETANPGLMPERLMPGMLINIPLDFSVVPIDINWCSSLLGYAVRGLTSRYPFISVGEIGSSVMGKPLWKLSIGSGKRSVLYSGGHHANEWITVPLLLKFLEELSAAFAAGDSIYGIAAARLLSECRIHIIPCLNIDGMDLVTGELQSGEFYSLARSIASDYPQFSFPESWKANIRGTDLNLQYPAGWEQAKENKFSQGIVSPAPADFVGRAPLCAPESRALYNHTRALDPALILAFHTQGQVIYWRYLDYMPPRSEEIGLALSAASGYPLEATPYASGFAGYKDWFIESFNHPGYTIEAGQGINPLPLSQFDEIYKDCLGILARAAELA